MAAPPSRPPRVLPWVEKYRPASVSDVASQEEVVSTLRTVVATGNLPHLLFYGPPGTGKTSTALALARELYGPEHWRSRVLELNASDERGIKVVREKVKLFAQSTVSRGTLPDGRPLPPFKMIVLDEADSMTSDAQSALRRVIEAHTRVTRFCLICNYVSRVIDPLASRCAKFRFNPLANAAMTAQLDMIAAGEGLALAPELVPTILRHSGGDMRKAVTFLQSAAQFYPRGQPVEAAVVTDIAGAVPTELLQRLWAAVRARSFNQLQLEVDELVANGFPVGSVLHQLCEDVVAADDLTDAQKATIALKLAQTDKCLCDGADESLQLLDVAATAMSAM